MSGFFPRGHEYLKEADYKVVKDGGSLISPEYRKTISKIEKKVSEMRRLNLNNLNLTAAVKALEKEMSCKIDLQSDGSLLKISKNVSEEINSLLMQNESWNQVSSYMSTLSDSASDFGIFKNWLTLNDHALEASVSSALKLITDKSNSNRDMVINLVETERLNNKKKFDSFNENKIFSILYAREFGVEGALPKKYVLYHGKEHLLGEGIGGRVKLAQEYDKPYALVAVKISNDSDDTSYKREIDGTSIFNQLKATSTRGNKKYIITNLIYGKDLSKAFIGCDNMQLGKPSVALNIMKSVAEQIELLHSNSGLHRDIRLQNIMYDYYSGTCHLIDFGTYCHIKKGETFYKDNSGIGDKSYQAPEIKTNGTCKYDVKSDLYAFGVLMVNFIRLCPSGKSKEIIQQDPIWLIIKACKDPMPENRPGNLKDFISKIDEAINDPEHHVGVKTPKM